MLPVLLKVSPALQPENFCSLVYWSRFLLAKDTKPTKNSQVQGRVKEVTSIFYAV